MFFGRLAERYRRDRSFLLAVALFTVASAACSMANSVDSLVVFRVAQAAGAALMTPTSLGLLLSEFPTESVCVPRTWTAIGGLGGCFLGPLVGGVWAMLNWRLIFLVNVPIDIAALLIGWWKLPRVPGHEAPKPNPWDAALVTAGIGALVFAIVKVNDWGWTSTGIGIAVAAAVALLASFFWRCLHSVNPLVDPALFRIRQFTGASLVAAPDSVAFGAMLRRLWEQTAWGWSALQTGLAIAPGPYWFRSRRCCCRQADQELRYRAGHFSRHLFVRRRLGLVRPCNWFRAERAGRGHRHDTDGHRRRLDLSHVDGCE